MTQLIKIHKVSIKASISLLFIILLFVTGCGPSLKLVKKEFYAYNDLSLELKRLHSGHKDIIDVLSIGKTYEGRSIFVIKIGGNDNDNRNKSALMAIFAEHSGEHETTSLAMGFVEHLVENYGKNKRITKLLNEKEVYILPMMNPDGVEYDLSGNVKPFTWRKNRRPVNKDAYGVDLNRNWGYKWDAPVPEKLAEQLRNPNDLYYHGEKPFSEYETQAVRDFLLSHKNIKIFLDYHSGSAGFIQGGTGFPFAYSEKEVLILKHRKRYEEIVQKFAELITDPYDKRPGYIVTQARDVRKHIKNYAPFYLKPIIGFFIPESTLAPGASGDWVYGELGIMSIGLEMFRNGGEFFNNLPASKNKFIENQIQGFLFLFNVLSDDPFKEV